MNIKEDRRSGFLMILGVFFVLLFLLNTSGFVDASHPEDAEKSCNQIGLQITDFKYESRSNSILYSIRDIYSYEHDFWTTGEPVYLTFVFSNLKKEKVYNIFSAKIFKLEDMLDIYNSNNVPMKLADNDFYFSIKIKESDLKNAKFFGSGDKYEMDKGIYTDNIRLKDYFNAQNIETSLQNVNKIHVFATKYNLRYGTDGETANGTSMRPLFFKRWSPGNGVVLDKDNYYMPLKSGFFLLSRKHMFTGPNIEAAYDSAEFNWVVDDGSKDEAGVTKLPEMKNFLANTSAQNSVEKESSNNLKFVLPNGAYKDSKYKVYRVDVNTDKGCFGDLKKGEYLGVAGPNAIDKDNDVGTFDYNFFVSFCSNQISNTDFSNCKSQKFTNKMKGVGDPEVFITLINNYGFSGLLNSFNIFKRPYMYIYRKNENGKIIKDFRYLGDKTKVENKVLPDSVKDNLFYKDNKIANFATDYIYLFPEIKDLKIKDINYTTFDYDSSKTTKNTAESQHNVYFVSFTRLEGGNSEDTRDMNIVFENKQCLSNEDNIYFKILDPSLESSIGTAENLLGKSEFGNVQNYVNQVIQPLSGSGNALKYKISCKDLKDNSNTLTLKVNPNIESLLITFYDYKQFAGEEGKADYFLGSKNQNSSKQNPFSPNYEFAHALIVNKNSANYSNLGISNLDLYNLNRKILNFYCPNCKHKFSVNPLIDDDVWETFGTNKELKSLIIKLDIGGSSQTFNLSDLLSKISSLRGEIEQKNEEIAGLKNTIDSLETENSSLKTEVEDLKIKLKEYTDLEKEYNKWLEDNSSWLKGYGKSSNMKNLKNISEFLKIVSDIHTKLESSLEEIKNLESKVSNEGDLENKLEAIRKKLEDREEKIEKLKSQIKQKDKRIKELEAKLLEIVNLISGSNYNSISNLDNIELSIIIADIQDLKNSKENLNTVLNLIVETSSKYNIKYNNVKITRDFLLKKDGSIDNSKVKDVLELFISYCKDVDVTIKKNTILEKTPKITLPSFKTPKCVGPTGGWDFYDIDPLPHTFDDIGEIQSYYCSATAQRIAERNCVYEKLNPTNNVWDPVLKKNLDFKNYFKNGDAWDLAGNNQVLWSQEDGTTLSKEHLIQIPGLILGVFYKNLDIKIDDKTICQTTNNYSNKENGTSKRYCHVVLSLGNKIIITGKTRIEVVDSTSFLKANKIIDVIAPKGYYTEEQLSKVKDYLTIAN